MTAKQFRRYWLTQKKRPIAIVSASVVAFFALTHSQIGCLGELYMTEGWRQLLGLAVPEYLAPLSALETKPRTTGLEPQLEQELTEWFLSYDRATSDGVDGTAFGAPKDLTLNEFLIFADQRSDPAAFLQQLHRDFPREIVLARERAVEDELRRVRSAEQAYLQTEETKISKAVATTQIAVTSQHIAKTKAKLRKFASDPRLLHRLSLYEADLKALKSL